MPLGNPRSVDAESARIATSASRKVGVLAARAEERAMIAAKAQHLPSRWHPTLLRPPSRANRNGGSTRGHPTTLTPISTTAATIAAACCRDHRTLAERRHPRRAHRQEAEAR